MKWFIILFSVLWIASGGLMILYTDRCREWLAKGFARMGRVPMAATAGIVGVLLLLSARGSHNVAVIMVLGLLAIAKGLLFFWNPNHIFETTRQWWLEKAVDQTYRLVGMIILVLGTALISWT